MPFAEARGLLTDEDIFSQRLFGETEDATKR